MSSQYSFSVSLGLEYALGQRFGIFAELGAGYTLQDSRNTTFPSESGPRPVYPTTDSTSHGIGLRSGIGAILFF